MTNVTLITGCSGTGKTTTLLRQYRESLDRARLNHQPGTTLWLTPSRRIQRFVTQQLMNSSQSVCFAPNVLTFDLFAQKILTEAGEFAAPISPVTKRLLLRRITRSMQNKGELRYFEPIAATTGFLDVISSFISELKREEIWPDTFNEACFMRSSALAQRDREVGAFYAYYQQHLSDQGWFDSEGRFWLARSLLADGHRAPFADIRTLVVDGFTDFTQTQYEILGHLAQWIEDIYISLPYESGRHDLFQKPRSAIEFIRKQLSEVNPTITVRWEQRDAIPRSTSSPSAERSGPDQSGNLPKPTSVVPPDRAHAIQVIGERLFMNPRFVQTTDRADGLEIIAATGPTGEWEAVAHRIKSMLAEGVAELAKLDESVLTTKSKNRAKTPSEQPRRRVRPQDIVIGLRSLSDDGPRLKAYLSSAGLPVWCEAESLFTSSPIVKAVLSVLKLELEDWSFADVLTVLDSTFFRPAWREYKSGQATRAAARLLRQLQLNSSRETILRVISRQADGADDGSGAGSNLTDVAQLAAPFLVRLSRTMDRLRKPHTLAEWADVLSFVAEELGFTPPAAANDPRAQTDSSDWDLLQRLLRTAAEADQKISTRLQKLTLAEFSSELRDLLSHTSIPPGPEPAGCIRILGVEQLRNLDIPHLFLIGMTETSFPSNRSDDCLFSEAERRDFNARGVALSHRSDQHADEMLLFYSIVTRARRSLTLSYPAVNSKGQPVFPSPYVSALQMLFSKEALKVTHEGKLDPVPETNRVLTPTDLRLAAMVEARHGHPELYRSVLENDSLRPAAWNALAACDVADQRFHQRGFTNYEGKLELPQNLAGLRQRFGHQHQFSATELEAYARCPFHFWLSNVLRIDVVESPEDGTDFAGRGNLLHEVLAKLLVEGTLGDPERLKSRFVELVNSQLDRKVPETELRRALINIERLILNEWAGAFVDQHSEYQQRLIDTLKDSQSLDPEIPFGRLPDAPSTSEKHYPEIQFGTADQMVKIRGRIDRVDIGQYEGHPAYVVIDYKTGRGPKMNRHELITGRSIQLALYLLAIKRLGLVGPDAIPFQMGIWALKETGFKPGMSRSFSRLDAAEVQALETILDDVLPRLAEGIRSGRFIVENEDDNCTGRCAYRTVCRVNQIRPLAELLEKQSPPPVDPVDDSVNN